MASAGVSTSASGSLLCPRQQSEARLITVQLETSPTARAFVPNPRSGQAMARQEVDETALVEGLYAVTYSPAAVRVKQGSGGHLGIGLRKVALGGDEVAER